MRLLLLLHIILSPLWCAIAVGATDCDVQADGTCAAATEQECIDSDPEYCPKWAAAGECDANPTYMMHACQVSCRACSKSAQELERIIAQRIKCPLDRSVPTVLPQKGDLDQLFEHRIINSDNDDTKNKKHYTTTVLSKDPWLVQLDDFLTQDECDLLIQWGHYQGFQRSHVATDGEIIARGRTSATAWCYGSSCLGAIQHVTQKIMNLINIPSENYEWLQILEYKEGQFYSQHHDYHGEHSERQCGPRILTLFLYLNDVEEGGTTNFNRLNVTIQPKRGRALIWPSVLNDDIWASDMRTEHEARPVKKGIKYGANVWIHARDYKGLTENNCHRI